MRRLLVANRGEIACRIIRTAKECGYHVTVLVTPDEEQSLAAKKADDTLLVSSFLSMEDIYAGAKSRGISFIHPGYGFLSENAEFAKGCEERGLIFIGPSSETIHKLGHKERAKEFALSIGLPVLPALSGDLIKSGKDSLKNLLASHHLKPPFLIKASGGGGGKGMRIVSDISELPHFLELASNEAEASFKNPQVFIERYLEKPRHIEVQVFGDGKGGGVFLGERECSLQRRYQKIIEECPSPSLSHQLREKLASYTYAFLKATKYRNAGTLEFLFDSDEFYFLEMNTRLQVEHPVTELVYDLDLVRCQLLLAEGQWPTALPDPKSESIQVPKKHAIELRILAEDFNFFPSLPGTLSVYQEPRDVRIDSGVEQGTKVNLKYDPMIAKLIGVAQTREACRQSLLESVTNYGVLGISHNLQFLCAILQNKDFIENKIWTTWIQTKKETIFLPFQKNIETFLQSREFVFKIKRLFEAPKRERDHFLEYFLNTKRDLTFSHGFQNLNNQNSYFPFSIEQGERDGEYFLMTPFLSELLSDDKTKFNTNDVPSSLLVSKIGKVKTEEGIRFFANRISPSKIQVYFLGCLETIDALTIDRESQVVASNEIKAPMAGKVCRLFFKAGDKILKDDVFCVIESMKMQFEVKAPREGILSDVFCQEQQVLLGPDIIAKIVDVEGKSD